MPLYAPLEYMPKIETPVVFTKENGKFCRLSVKQAMPKVKRSRKPPPEGWELIEPTLDELDQKMREGKY